MWYYIDKNNHRKGPVAADVLLKQMTPETLVWKEGMTEWLPATQVPELASLVPPPTPQGTTSPPVPGKDKKNLYAAIAFAALVLFIVGYFALKPKEHTYVNASTGTVESISADNFANEETTAKGADKKAELYAALSQSPTSYIVSDVNTYYYNTLTGGISDLSINIQNYVQYSMDVTYSVEYISKNEYVLDTKTFVKTAVPGKNVLYIPDYPRGMSVYVTLTRIQCKDIGFDKNFTLLVE